MTLEILTADQLKNVKHGFFTRRGGASSGVFHGLNCGLGSGDQAEIVQINRSRVAAAMGVMPAQLTGVHQAHTHHVIEVSTPMAERPIADAMVCKERGIALSVLTADCQPVLLADQTAGIIGAAHAGWRGTLNGVLENTVEAMVTLGAKRDDIAAVIGPCISQNAYEVGPEFVEQFLADDPTNERFFRQGTADRRHFDLPAFGLDRLRRAGVGKSAWIKRCTFTDAERFYSYRRSTHAKDADYGRLISVILQ
ncbi:MAG: peptidoglycan editing factor PgeF [Pseudomonadota bacterium]